MSGLFRASERYGFQIFGDPQFRLGDFLHLFRSDARRYLAQQQSLGRDLDDRQFGYDQVHDFVTGERQSALLEDFRSPILLVCSVAMMTRWRRQPGPSLRPSPSASCRDGPIRKVPFLIYLHRAQHGQVHMTASNHGKRVCA